MRRLLLVGTLSACAIATSAGAARELPAPPAPSPPGAQIAPPPPTTPLTLADAVSYAVSHSPALSARREDVRAAHGARTSTLGAFDARFSMDGRLTLQQQHLPPALVQHETGKRQLIGAVADSFSVVLDQLRASASTPGAPPQCPTGLRTGTGVASNTTTIDRRDPTEVALLGVHLDVVSSAATNLASLGPFVVVIDGVTKYDFEDICGTSIAQVVPAGLLSAAWTAVSQSGTSGLQGTLTSVDQIGKETPAALAQIAETVATRARLALDRLGNVPTEVHYHQAAFDASLSRALRSGPFVEGRVHLESQAQEYAGKPLDPAFGGFDVAPLFQSWVSVGAQIPLGKGSGRATTEAVFRAADLALDARRDELRSSIADVVRQTVLSYLDLMAAQERRRVLAESAARQERLVQLTRNRVDAGEASQADLGRAAAHAALTDSAVSAAGAALVAARTALASKIGLDANDLAHMPSALGSFATPPASLGDVDTLARRALLGRRDVKALENRRVAATTLTAAAHANLRTAVDLSIEAGLSTLYDSPFFRYFPDERGPIVSQFGPRLAPELPPVRFSSPGGFFRASTSPWQPFVQASITIRFPFSNHAASGRHAQAQATVEDALVRERDLQRQIRQNVIALAGAIEDRRAARDRAAQEVAQLTEVLNAITSLYAAGERTLLDTLLTEQTVTEASLDVLEQQRQLAAAHVRLSYETSDLVRFGAAGGGIEAVIVDVNTFVHP